MGNGIGTYVAWPEGCYICSFHITNILECATHSLISLSIHCLCLFHITNSQHFVVYKAPALVGAVSAYTDCKLEYVDDKPGVEVIDNRPAVPNYKVKKKDEGDEAINLTLAHLNVDTTTRGVKLTFSGDLCCASGIGASAAQVVSLARAVNIADNRSLSEDEINAAGYEGEKGYHGTPSGIDNTAATFGGLLRFQRTDGAPIFEKKSFPSAIRIVYASTGITASTTRSCWRCTC